MGKSQRSERTAGNSAGRYPNAASSRKVGNDSVGRYLSSASAGRVPKDVRSKEIFPDYLCCLIQMIYS